MHLYNLTRFGHFLFSMYIYILCYFFNYIACLTKTVLAVFCLHHFLPHVGNIGTISKTLNDIGLPIVPFSPMERSPNARFVSS